MSVRKASLENLKKGKPFSSENQPENRGRKPSVLARYIKENGVSLTDVKATITSLLFAYNANEIAAMLKDKNNPLPMGITSILKAIVADQKTGSINVFDKLLDRAFGKPTQTSILEVHDIPEKAKERIDRIFGEAEDMSEKIKPKIVSRIKKKKESGEG